jgi:hypothetical protein
VLAGQSRFPVRGHYFTKAFKEDRCAIHCYASIQGHELVARRNLIPTEPGTGIMHSNPVR